MKYSPALRALSVTALASTLLLGGLRPAGAAGTALLRYHYTVGQTFSEQSTTTTHTLINGKAVSGSVSQPITQSSTEVDRFVVTATVQKVLKDGSAMVRVTFGQASITKDGKTSTPSLKSYYLVEHVSTDGHVLSKKTYGEATLSADTLSALPKPEPTQYPAGPVGVGSTWTINKSDTLGGLGKLSVNLQYKLLALGSQGGRQTATTSAIFALPLKVKQPGVTIAGTFSGTQTDQFFVDTGSSLTGHSSGLFTGTLSGVSNGVTIKGKFSYTLAEENVAVS